MDKIIFKIVKNGRTHDIITTDRDPNLFIARGIPGNLLYETMNTISNEYKDLKVVFTVE